MMLLVGGVIPDLHKVKTVSAKLSVISYTLVDLNCLFYIQNVLVLLSNLILLVTILGDSYHQNKGKFIHGSSINS
jgi:hypothetical protein